MVQQAEELANLLDVLSSISEAHAVEAENQSHKLSCDPPPHAPGVHACECPQQLGMKMWSLSWLCMTAQVSH